MQKSKVFDLKKRTFIYSLDLIGFLKSTPKEYISLTIGKQLLRCGTSIGANVNEAYAASSKRDFANYFNMALKSGNESKYWLMILKYSKIGDAEKIDTLLQETKEVCSILAKSLITMRGKS